MFRPLSTLNLATRVEGTASAWVLASGATGTFVAVTATGYGKPADGDYGLPIWSESNRDGSAGFSPDITATGNITVIYGKMRAATDQYTDSPAIGNRLKVGSDGKLVAVTTDVSTAISIVARCVKAPYTLNHLGSDTTVIDIELV